MRAIHTLLTALTLLAPFTLSSPIPQSSSSSLKNHKNLDADSIRNKVRSGAVAMANKDQPQDGRVQKVAFKNGVGQAEAAPVGGGGGSGGPQGPNGGPANGTVQGGGSGGGAQPGGQNRGSGGRVPPPPQGSQGNPSQNFQRNPSAPATVQAPPSRGGQRSVGKQPAQQQGNQGQPRDRRGQMAVNGKQRSPFNKEFNGPAQKRTRGKKTGAAAAGAQQVASSG